MTRPKVIQAWQVSTKFSTFKYLIVHDPCHDHGTFVADRNTVLVMSPFDPVCIGRELSMRDARACIERFEANAKSMVDVYEYTREDIVRCLESLPEK